MRAEQVTRRAAAETAGTQDRPLPGFFYRLSAARQRTYLKSDAIDRLPFVTAPATLEAARILMRALEIGARAAVNEAAYRLVAELCSSMRVLPVRIEVREVRPHNARGELHGIFYPARPPLIVLWMRTAQRHDIVKPRTFLRTLIHEVGHYLDYALLKLGDSFHTSGFFRRESFLVRALCPPAKISTAPEPPSLALEARNLKDWRVR